LISLQNLTDKFYVLPTFLS